MTVCTVFAARILLDVHAAVLEHVLAARKTLEGSANLNLNGATFGLEDRPKLWT
jgi:hypothetical protein